METTGEGVHSVQVLIRDNKLKLDRFFMNQELKYMTKEYFWIGFASFSSSGTHIA
jgi:hypothetical protein